MCFYRHMSGHMCYALIEEKALFSGDHVMGWSTTVIAPPDGDMTDYMASLDLLLERDDVVYWPTHGSCINDPQNFVRAYITHRRGREAQLIERLKAGDRNIKQWSKPFMPMSIRACTPLRRYPRWRICRI